MSDLDFTPLPESEQEKRIKKVMDKIEDMYDDEDYHKYVWGFIVSRDGGKTFDQVDGFRPVGSRWALVDEQPIAPIASNFIIEPVVYTIKAVSASEFLPEHHPVILLKRQHETAPVSGWEAPPGKDDYTLTFDLGEERVIGCIEFWPKKPGKYHVKIGSSSDPANFVLGGKFDYENFGPATNIVLPYLVKNRYVQIKTDCNAIKQVRILSMSENARPEEKAELSKEFYIQQATKSRRKG